MLKLLILLLVILSVGFVSFQQGSKNTPYRNAEIINKSEFEPSVKQANTNTPDTEQVINSELVLNLSSNGLIETPKSVFEQTDIEVLNLSYNKLTGSLQAEIRFLQNLKVLNLSNNQFTGVPAEIGQLKYLEVLDLSNNHITGLPLEVGNLSNLKILNLRGNEYSKYDLERIKETLPPSTVIQIE